MHLLSLLCASLFAASLASGKQCVNITVPVSIAARNGIFNIAPLQNNLDATTFAQNLTSGRGNFTQEALLGYATVTGDYTISARFCQPDSGVGSSPVVQFLTHGIGFDKTYWEVAYNNFNYSYVDVAVDEYGFCTLAIDRLGIGASSIADPLQTIQAPAELAAIHDVTMKLREGSLPSVPYAFEKVVHVGHSFGSGLSLSLAAMYPNVSDGLILTGFSGNASALPQTIAGFNFKLARLNQPLRFGNVSYSVVTDLLSMVGQVNASLINQYLAELNLDVEEIMSVVQTTDLLDFIAGIDPSAVPHAQDLPTGYITWTDVGNNQFNFLYPGFFDTGVLFFSESSKFPATLGEFLTIGGGPSGAPSFTGPVQVITGNEDKIYCNSDCMATGDPALASIPAGLKAGFPAAQAFEAYIQPNTGHAINIHYNATGAYRVMQQFLGRNGLAPS